MYDGEFIINTSELKKICVSCIDIEKCSHCELNCTSEMYHGDILIAVEPSDVDERKNTCDVYRLHHA